VAVSPDGANVYVASAYDDAVAIFDRNATTGGLTQKAGTAGCISDNGASAGVAGRCVDGRGLDGAAGVGVTPDGQSVYVTSGTPLSTQGAIAIFDRDTATGALTQRTGTAGCISDSGGDGCATGVGLAGYDTGAHLTFSADSRNVYAANNGLAIFQRTAMHGVDIAVTGQGTVTSSPAGIDCGADCSETVAQGSTLTLTATPAAGWEFQDWTGPCAGAGRTCALAPREGITMQATFIQVSAPGASQGGASSAKPQEQGSSTRPGTPVARMRARWSKRARVIIATPSPVAGATRYVIGASGAATRRGTCAITRRKATRGKKAAAPTITCRITLTKRGSYTISVEALKGGTPVGRATATRRIR
jgi:DNA-binding beta-propeller fold protein YncE